MQAIATIYFINTSIVLSHFDVQSTKVPLSLSSIFGHINIQEKEICDYKQMAS